MRNPGDQCPCGLYHEQGKCTWDYPRGVDSTSVALQRGQREAKKSWEEYSEYKSPEAVAKRWENCDREEAIRQCEAQSEAREKWMNLFYGMRDERDEWHSKYDILRRQIEGWVANLKKMHGAM